MDGHRYDLKSDGGDARRFKSSDGEPESGGHLPSQIEQQIPVIQSLRAPSVEIGLESRNAGFPRGEKDRLKRFVSVVIVEDGKSRGLDAKDRHAC